MTAEDGTGPNEHYLPFASFAAWNAEVKVPDSLADFELLLNTIRQVTDESILEQARIRLTEYAAIETGALEGLYEAGRGFTITVAEHGAIIQAIQQARGEQVARTVEDQMEAFNLTFDVSTRRESLTEVFVRRLHEINCRNQRTYTVYTPVGPQERDLVPGRYKTEPNNPYRPEGELAHAYAPPLDVAPEMERLVAELNTREFDEAHPAIQAAYSHYGFVSIHPFPDGNGRVARSLASVFTYRRPGVPLLIFDDEKVEYIRSLEAADAGRYQAFTGFITECLIESVQLVKEYIDDAAAPSDQQAVARLRETLSAGFGEDLTHPEADALAGHLLDLAYKEVAAWVESHSLPDGVNVHGGLTHGGIAPSEPPDGYRPLVGNARYISVNVNIHPPAEANVQVRIAPIISTADGQMFDFQLVAVAANGSAYVAPFGVRLAEIKPHPTSAMGVRLQGWIRRLASKAMDEANQAADARLRAQGYRR